MNTKQYTQKAVCLALEFVLFKTVCAAGLSLGNLKLFYHVPR